MTLEQMNIAIAKAFPELLEVVDFNNAPMIRRRNGGTNIRVSPVDDLNLIHELERMVIGLITDSKGRRFATHAWDEYVANLYRVVNGLERGAYYHWSDLGSNSEVVSATAAQRAEAICWTLELEPVDPD